MKCSFYNKQQNDLVRMDLNKILYMFVSGILKTLSKEKNSKRSPFLFCYQNPNPRENYEKNIDNI